MLRKSSDFRWLVSVNIFASMESVCIVPSKPIIWLFSINSSPFQFVNSPSCSFPGPYPVNEMWLLVVVMGSRTPWNPKEFSICFIGLFMSALSASESGEVVLRKKKAAIARISMKAMM